MLHETIVEEDNIDLNNVMLSHYRVSKIRQQHLQIQENKGEYNLEPNEALGTARPKNKKEEFLSLIDLLVMGKSD